MFGTGLRSSKSSLSSAKQGTHCYCFAPIFKNGSNVALLLWKGKCDCRDLQNASQVPFVLKLREYQENTIFQENDAPLLLPLFPSEIGPKEPQPLDGESLHHFMAHSLTRFDIVWGILQRYLNNIVYSKPPNKISVLKTKTHGLLQVPDSDSSKNVYKTLENGLRIVLSDAEVIWNMF